MDIDCPSTGTTSFSSSLESWDTFSSFETQPGCEITPRRTNSKTRVLKIHYNEVVASSARIAIILLRGDTRTNVLFSN